MNTYTSEPVIFRRFGRAKNTTTYYLPDFLFTYILAGSGTVCVGNERRPFSAGDSFVIARRQEAVVTLLPDTQLPDTQLSGTQLPDESAKGYFLTISIRISEEEIEDYFLHSTAPDKLSDTSYDLSQQLSDHPLLHGLSRLLEEGTRQGFRAEWKFTKMKIQECIHILVALNEGIYYWFSVHNRLQKINLQTFMEKNFHHNIPLGQLAEAAGRSLSTFRRDFSQEFGTTPSRWLIARRLEEARCLIASGKHPGEILIELGFESFSHFTRCFKQRFGMLPSEVLNKS